MKKILAIGLIAALASGCATHQPVVDTKGVDMNAYTVDLAECQKYAEQINPAGTAAAGAGAGALFGALLGAAIGGRGSAGYGARIGAAQGVGAGAAGGAGKQIQIINNCMSGRGYRVLG
jgi:hypothetical protein